MVQAVRDLVDWLLAESPKMKNSLHGMQPLALASPLLMHLPSSHPLARPPSSKSRLGGRPRIMRLRRFAQPSGCMRFRRLCRAGEHAPPVARRCCAGAGADAGRPFDGSKAKRSRGVVSNGASPGADAAGSSRAVCSHIGKKLWEPLLAHIEELNGYLAKKRAVCSRSSPGVALPFGARARAVCALTPRPARPPTSPPARLPRGNFRNSVETLPCRWAGSYADRWAEYT